MQIMLVYIDTAPIIEYNIAIQIKLLSSALTLSRTFLLDIWVTSPKYPSAILFRKKGVGYQPASFVFLEDIIAHEFTKNNSLFEVNVILE